MLLSNKRPAPTTTIALLVASILAGSAVVAAASAPSRVVYSRNTLDASWRDASWNANLVDFQSNDAIDAEIGEWGAFSLAKMTTGSAEGDDVPSFVKTIDPAASDLTMRVQGPLRSSSSLTSGGGGADKWLFLTDGRVIPRLSPASAFVKTIDKYAKPVPLSSVQVYLEDSASGKSSKAHLLSALVVGARGVPRGAAVLVDDGEWTEIRANLRPMLEAAQMSQWDKIVLKDAQGNGFHLRLGAIALAPPAEEEEETAAGPMDEEEEAASVFSRGIDSLPKRSKVVRSWVPQRTEAAPRLPPPSLAADTDMADGNATTATHAVALEEFTHKRQCASYGSPTTIAHISDGGLKEPSGFAASRRYKGVLWTHQDRDTDPFLYAVIAKTGEVVSKLYVDTKKYGETDWEDIAVALCPDKSGDHCLWIADSGNVRRDREVFFVHVMREPTLERHGKIEAWDVWTIPYQFPAGFYASDEGRRPWIDVESLMVAPDASKLWLVEKTVNHNGAGPVTVWETPVGQSPLDLIGRDTENVLLGLTKKGRDGVHDHPDFLVQMALANKLTNPRISRVTSFLRPEAFNPPLPQWAREKYEERGLNWNKLRAITGMDMHPSGKAVVACTYSGIWEYPLRKPFDLGGDSVGEPRLLSVTSKYDDAFWQTEAIAYDSEGDGIYLASEYYKGHQPIRFFGCRDDVLSHLEKK